ncbi:MAG: putative helicase [Gemmataceae bacterium]|nr:putative helicase [Gemmataceae bacterium]
MATQTKGSDFYREYDLGDTRRRAAGQAPAPHQQQALQALDRWYKSAPAEPRGGILVLPTGGGKTFTAGHFLCRNPLSDGFRVLWLAHTHHLLEQAFAGFERLVGLVAEPRAGLNVRVVSGTIGHFPVHAIRPTDDVVVGSVQTVGNALANGHERLASFLDAAGRKLFVVFDEAHHAPAPSYRRLVQGLRDRCPNLHLLGLTATPTHTEVNKRGWLHRLFPQGIVYQVDPQTLMAAGVLARPVLEEARTEFEPAFDEREYERWVGTNRDLPDDVIDALATSRERNDRIVGHYVGNRERYGKTIIFADRWPQCVYLCEALRRRGVRADAIYSHVDANPGTAEGRARRTASENATVLRDFRAGNLDVLVNIRMATEGTDVPDVQTVFLTRQTTSQILLTQMVGRALRGPKFGGTDRAFIVSFIDDWRHRINWAAYDRLAPGLADETVPEYGARPPLQLLSIDLVRRLARQMDAGVNVNPAPYRTFLPVGWYRVEYAARVEGTDDDESVGQLVMVFEAERAGFERLIADLRKAELGAFEDPTVRLDDVREVPAGWEQEYFADTDERVGGGLAADLFAVARHLAQNDRDPPRFFPFGVRDDHDLDAVARRGWAEDLGPRRQDEALQAEYTRHDRYWRVIYHTYGQFKSHFDACMNRLLDAHRHQADPVAHRPTFRTPEAVPVAEPSEDLKERVKSRDGYRCVCCGYGKRRSVLTVDHISPSYHGGTNQFDNLQTLCNTCNTAKGIERISFRNHQTALTGAPPRLPVLKLPAGENARDPEWWEMFLRRTLNLFYRCAAVDAVEIGSRGERLRHWRVRLFPGNDPAWVGPHLASLAEEIRGTREGAGYTAAPEQITVTG